jgi:hypothetical protein
MRLARGLGADPAMAHCSRCGASVNTLGDIDHWSDCNAPSRDIKFRAPKGTLPRQRTW